MMTQGGPLSAPSLRCPKCSLSLESTVFTRGAWVQCPACKSHLSGYLFHALTAPPELVTTASGERALEGESVCFFHPEKRAAVACERCGRFLCALCDVPFGGKHLCPSCLDSKKMPELVNHRLIWGKLSLLLGAAPFLCTLICFPGVSLWGMMAFITGPAAIICGIWGWKKPPSLVFGHRHGMAVFGMILGLLLIGGIVAGIWGIAKYAFLFND